MEGINTGLIGAESASSSELILLKLSLELTPLILSVPSYCGISLLYGGLCMLLIRFLLVIFNIVPEIALVTLSWAVVTELDIMLDVALV